MSGGELLLEGNHVLLRQGIALPPNTTTRSSVGSPQVGWTTTPATATSIW